MLAWVIFLVIAKICKIFSSANKTCILKYEPICVLYEDCGFTLNSKCLIDIHNKFNLNGNNPPMKTFIPGACPKDKKKCPYSKILQGLMFQ
ncbi:uncharacterized protein LOC128261985 [Drosophila gunungcola]|uniref:Uncharacterized protein n=1 Tax=Drosophila gunungcola TaxID=103775 RepID=A0A9P9YSM4_9MUSC|nr:uncharacterized protein LOC128261985 [Drosophila gunungcola]KAI8042331.1 hypothetical protein M5D96_003634 [Drosophila gunungcola]